MREFTSKRTDDTPPEDNPLAGVAFVLDGKTFECKGRMNLLEGSILASAAVMDEATVQTSPQTMGLVAEFLRVAFGEEEFHRFRMHVRAYGTPDEVLLEIMNDIRSQTEANVAVISGRPTEPPRQSSPGPTDRDGHIARVISLQSGDVQMTSPPPAGPQVDPALAAERSDQAAAKAAAKGTGKGSRTRGGSTKRHATG